MKLGVVRVCLVRIYPKQLLSKVWSEWVSLDVTAGCYPDSTPARASKLIIPDFLCTAAGETTNNSQIGIPVTTIGS